MVKCFLFVAHELNDKKPNTHDLKTTILQKKKKTKSDIEIKAYIGTSNA